MRDIDYRIGLDIGTNSIGWSVIGLHFNEEEQQYEKESIIDLGVRMFDKAEMRKGEPLSLPRRTARSTRRRLKRKSRRIQAIRQLLIQYEILSEEELKKLYPLQKESVDIWDIRLDGLDRFLNRYEWARLLIHLAQRRGFKSNRKSDSNDKETGKVLSSIDENQKLLATYRTVGEMWMKDEKFLNFERRRNSPDEYIFNVSRYDLEQEIIALFEAQRQFSSNYASVELQEEYLTIWNSQLPFASGKDILDKVGFCSLEKKEKRIPKATYTFHYFAVLDKINNLRIGKEYLPLSKEQREIILQKIFDRTDYINKKTIPKVTYADLRKWLQIEDTLQFKGLTYDPNEDIKKTEKQEFISLKPYYEIRKVVLTYSEHSDLQFDFDDYDAIGYALTVYKNDADIRAYLQKENNLARRVYPEQLIEQLLNLSYSKFGHLSFKALHKVLPVMKKGVTFAKAVEEVGYGGENLQQKRRAILLPVIQDEINNPIVKRAISQSRKVVNAIIRKYGSPVTIHIELARELSKNFEDRQKIIKEQDNNYSKNKGAIKVLLENGIRNPTGYDIVRYKLWVEQDEKCVYSQKKIPANIFFHELRRERNSSPTLDVDHILPYSQSFLDNYHNKVLVYSDENRKKADRIPYEYLNSQPENWKAFKDFVQTNKSFSRIKRGYLLKEEYSPRESDLAKERHLNDTRYATRYLKNFIESNLRFKETKRPIKKRVHTVNGKITAHFRSRWGLEKSRQNTFLHHALDAVVVACTDSYMVTKVTEYYQQKEKSKNQKQLFFPLPWTNFRDDILKLLNVDANPKEIIDNHSQNFLLVSRKPNRSVKGLAHKATIDMKGYVDEKSGKTVIYKRVPLNEIKFDENGDFAMVGKDADLATYDAIKQRYLQHGKDAKKAFASPLYKPCKSGNGNKIKRVKVVLGSKTFVREVNGGVAENGDLIRLDMFQREGIYYMVPIYVFDTTLPELPNRIATYGKGYERWAVVDESYEFKFSLYRNELVRLVTDDIDVFLHFNTIDGGSNRVTFTHVNRLDLRQYFGHK